MEPYNKVRVIIEPSGQVYHYPAGTVSPEKLDEDVIDERHMYGMFENVQAVDDAARTVIALFEHGLVRLTQYR
jgi:hypothetical protein